MRKGIAGIFLGAALVVQGCGGEVQAPQPDAPPIEIMLNCSGASAPDAPIQDWRIVVRGAPGQDGSYLLPDAGPLLRGQGVLSAFLHACGEGGGACAIAVDHDSVVIERPAQAFQSGPEAHFRFVWSRQAGEYVAEIGRTPEGEALSHHAGICRTPGRQILNMQP